MMISSFMTFEDTFDFLYPLICCLLLLNDGLTEDYEQVKNYFVPINSWLKFILPERGGVPGMS